MNELDLMDKSKNDYQLVTELSKIVRSYKDKNKPVDRNFVDSVLLSCIKNDVVDVKNGIKSSDDNDVFGYFDIDSMYEEIYDSAYMNSKRWDVNLFEEDLMYLKDFIRERIDFLDRAWINKENTYYVEVQTGINYKSYTVFDIMTVEELFTKEQIDVTIDNLIYRDTGKSVHKDDVISSEYTVMDDVRYIGE